MPLLEELDEALQQLLDPTFAAKLLFKLAMIFLIIGGLNWFAFGLFKLNFVDMLFGDGPIAKLLYIIIGVSALAIMFDRDTYLPFLGPMVAPCSVLKNSSPPGATRSVKVVVTPNSKVLYWASEPSNDKFKKLNTWKQAYLSYENAGVTTSDENGVAILRVRDPQPYSVIMRGKINSHVHYRVCGESGWMGRIRTVFIDKDSEFVEGFQSSINKKIADKKNKLDISDYSASIY